MAPVLAAVLTVAVLIGAVSYAVRTNPTTNVAALPGATRLDYAADPPGSLTPLSPDFVAQSLGISFPAAGPAAGPVAPFSAGGGPRGEAVSTAVNPVNSPTYHCVNGHQTEDPLSPPCVAQFTGDNGGATYQGVTGNEVRVLVTIDPAEDIPFPHGQATWGSYYDLGQPPQPDEATNMPWAGRLRLLQSYFNQRYQTFGRRVRLIVYSIHQAGAEAFKNAALENDILFHPFAVLAAPQLISNPAYTDTLAGRGVPTFDLFNQWGADHFSARPGLLWGYVPAAEHAADLYASFVCQKAARRPVVLSGNPGENGRPRKFGLLQVAAGPEQRHFVSMVRNRLEACGVHIDAFADIPLTTHCADVVDSETGGGPGTESVTAMADFKRRGVTTILWPGCASLRPARAASALAYTPEWILWGSGNLDLNDIGGLTSGFAGAWHRHAVLVTPTTFQPEVPQRLCYKAQLEEDPHTPPDDVADTTCLYYEGLRQVFSLLQLAGPYLTPAALDAGARTFSPPASSPQTPRCLYPAGDFTCIKDAQVEWWDALGPGQPAGQSPFLGVKSGGCWRAAQLGRRYEPGRWPVGNIDAQLQPSDPCTLHGAHGA